MYIPSLNFRRTPEEKADPLLSWKRDDINFFAAGACHILAFAFMKLHPNENFSIIYTKPKKGFSGNHLYVTNGNWAFDYGGWTLERVLLEETTKAYSEKYPGWEFEKVIVEDDLETFCKNNNHRLPEQFAFLPWERAYNYIKQFPSKPPQYVAGIIIQNKKILLLQRVASDRDAGKWTPVNETIETNETPEEAVMRGVKEEVGLKFTITQRPGTNQHNELLETFVGTATGTITIAPEEVAAYGWFSYEEAKHMEYAFGYEKIIEDLSELLL